MSKRAMCLFFIAYVLSCGYSQLLFAKCAQCAESCQKVGAIVKCPNKATDQQLQELSSLVVGLCQYCCIHYCDNAIFMDALFADPAFLQCMERYFDTNPARLDSDPVLVSQLLFRTDTSKNSIISLIATHLDIIKNEWLVSRIEYVAQEPDIKNKLADGAIAHISTISGNVLRAIAGDDVEVIKQFIGALDKNGDYKAVISLAGLVLSIPEYYYYSAQENTTQEELRSYGWSIIKKKLTSFFTTKSKAVTFELLLCIALYKSASGALPDGISLPALPTGQHMVASCVDCFKIQYSFGCFIKYFKHKRAHKVVDSVIAFEQKFADSYYTFVHGQQWGYRLLEQWYTWLWEIEQNRTAQDYIFVHCRPLKKGKELESERALRKDILENGRSDWESRQRLLFLNAPFFGNLTNPGSCTAQYAYNNTNVGCMTLSLRDIFEMFNCSSCYEKYEDELAALEQEHNTLSKHGQVLFLAVPQNIIKETVYCAAPGGYKREVNIDGQSVDDIAIILDTLRKDASRIECPDYIEFCLVLTDDMLTPDSGIKVHSLAMANEEKIRVFDAKSRALFERMKKDVQKEWKSEKHMEMQ